MTSTSLPLSLASISPLSARQAGRDLPPGCAALIVVDPPRPDTILWHLSALWCHWLWGHSAGAPLEPFLNRRRLDWDWFWRGLRGALGAITPLLRPEGRLVCLWADGDMATFEALTLAAAGAGYELIGWGARPPGEARLAWRFDRLTAPRVDKLTAPRVDKLTAPRVDKFTTQRVDELTAPRVDELAARRVDATPAPIPVETDPLSRAVAERAAGASLNVLLSRGEPVAWPTLHAAIYAGLAEGSLLAQAATLPDKVTDPLPLLTDAVRSALDGAPLRQLMPEEPITQPPSQRAQGTTQPLWWLDEPLESEAASPLSDRVELAVANILRELLAVTEADLHRRVCARFPGPETPDARLVRLCLFSYGDEHAPGHWRLRVEDDFEARVTETDAVIADLDALGRRLGFEVRLGIPREGEWAVRWLDESGSTGSPHVSYAFAVRTTAVLGDLLFNPPPPSPPPAEGKHRTSPPLEGTGGGPIEPKTTPCLTLPGGRAVLVGYKLRHDPRLRRQVARHGWQFLKFRHLRHLVQEVAAKQLDRYAFQAALGLDPIVERVEVQMSLW